MFRRNDPDLNARMQVSGLLLHGTQVSILQRNKYMSCIEYLLLLQVSVAEQVKELLRRALSRVIIYSFKHSSWIAFSKAGMAYFGCLLENQCIAK